jgi:hypothetical protein
VQPATLEAGGGHSQFGSSSDVNFSAGVNFSGQRLAVPGPDLFPVDPATHAGPVGQQGYSPLWDVHPAAWTQAAIDAGLRTLLTSHQQVEALFNQGLLVSAAPDGPVNHDPEVDGLRAAGVVVNCPPVFVAPPA